MSEDELTRQDRHLLDNIAFTSDAHEAGMLDAFEEIFREAQRPGATIDSLNEVLRQRIAQFKQARPANP